MKLIVFRMVITLMIKINDRPRGMVHCIVRSRDSIAVTGRLCFEQNPSGFQELFGETATSDRSAQQQLANTASRDLFDPNAIPKPIDLTLLVL
jgi:hypothetical protein